MNKISYLAYFVFLSLIFFSCEKSLDLSPKTSYSEATFFQTSDQFKLFANQFYYYLPVCGHTEDRDIYSDIVAARATNTVSNGSYYATTSSDYWDTPYKCIRYTTYLIQKGNELSTGLKNEIAVYVGEAKFFRALAYFDLLRNYGGVPIIDKVLNLNDDNLLYGSRNSREEVVNFIIKDLDEAIDNLPVESKISDSDKGRVSKGAALALKARVSLFEGTWRKYRNLDGYAALLDKAIDASDQVMKSGEYKLFDRRDVLGDESYFYFFILDKEKSNVAGLTKADQKEYILANRFDATIRGVAGGRGVQYLPNPTKKFANMFLCTDGLPIEKSPLFKGKATITSEYENRDLRMKNVFLIPGTQFWEHNPVERKRDWSNPSAGGIKAFLVFGQTTYTGYQERKFNYEISPGSIDLPIFRYAEVLLVSAEALYEKNGSISDDQLDLTINKLRTRAGLAKLSNAFVSSNGLNMRTEIRRERTIELFMEGQRFDDLRRWKTAETELPQALAGIQWAGTEFETNPEYSNVSYPLDSDGCIIIEDASKRKFEEKHYLFPLPTRQILLNPQLVQNPGW